MSTQPEIAVSGFGLFSARPSRVVFRSAAGPTGIRFVHASNSRVVPALIANQRAASGPLGGRNTVIGDSDFTIATVEHLLSALAGLNVWHIDIATEPGELPILDGSAAGFVQTLRDAALISPSPRAIRLAETIRVEDSPSGAWIEARPSNQVKYRYELFYPPGSGIPEQSFEWNGDRDQYATEIAPARTFSLEREALAMKTAGLFPHLTPRDMLVIAPDGRAIDNALRFADEPARHKLLDLIGDLALLGGPLVAEVTAHKSSHALTHELCRRIAALES
ncbi:MAG: UDP-3-O-acyl-N-acetylglucosamine deacetylase [Phycisphaerales bacterium]